MVHNSSKRSSALRLLLVGAVAACGSDSAGPGAETFQVALSESPGVTTTATGSASFAARANAIDFEVSTANLENFIMTHIHLGAAGESGPIVVWLRPTAPPPENPVAGPINGELARGSFTATALVGALENQGLDELLRLMRKDSVYVNVHTSQNPGGEIRGQIRPQ